MPCCRWRWAHSAGLWREGSDNPNNRQHAEVSSYGKDGNLTVGLYVSENTKDFDPNAVAGFERTRELLKTRPRVCALD